ncbi:MAG: [FeFe] hydrogenase H-cluster radical SAM maturase HydG [Oligoflexia bacterium]|nr:[FeFe] hydrogenase H-cluster radical SAM maturase HydG [Oligoflexia bacterium]
MNVKTGIINESEIFKKINSSCDKNFQNDRNYIEEIFAKAKELNGITPEQVLSLLQLKDNDLIGELYNTAKEVKDTIYGKRIVLFAPLYISNICYNECLYCAFRSSNTNLHRKKLSQKEIITETKHLINDGHKRLLLVAAEDNSEQGLDYMLESIASVYSVTTDKGSIRRINVNMAPLSMEGFKKLGECKIGTYQIFQETYHQETYKQNHLRGHKSNYQYRLQAMDRALAGGIHDLGMGILFGLYDYRFEILALLKHVEYLEKNFAVGPHTLSVPRIEPAFGSEVSMNPPYPVSDEIFKKIIAVLRLAVPYTGLILSTRESGTLRKDALDLGISQISAGSKTNPGGYTSNVEEKEEQFSLSDKRSILEVIKDIVSDGYIPSFCTGCYRMGRVGADFMELAKPGLIHKHCTPNAMFTFKEYLEDFADNDLKFRGEKVISEIIESNIMGESLTFKNNLKIKLQEIANGTRDIYY